MPAERVSEYELIEGRNPVLEAIRGPRRVFEVVIVHGIAKKGTLSKIVTACERKEIPVRVVEKNELEEMARTSSPQGVIAKVSPYRFASWTELIESDGGSAPLLLVLDRVEDPQNLGSIIRAADAAGADGVIVAKRRSAHVTAAVAKASAGALEHVRIAQVSSIAATLSRLKEEGLWIVGAEASGGVPYYDIDLTVPVAIVLGGEGTGLARLVKERCDFMASLPMLGEVSSLNVASTGAVLLYEAVRQRLGVT